MKISDVQQYLGKYVRIVFFDDTEREGVMGYTPFFSYEYGYRKPNYFYIGNLSFKASHVKKIKEMIEESDV